jgi:hypothetical protein
MLEITGVPLSRFLEYLRKRATHPHGDRFDKLCAQEAAAL